MDQAEHTALLEKPLHFPDGLPGLETADDAILFVPVSIDSETRQMFLNLLGPFVVNAKTKIGRQLVPTGTDYTTRTLIGLPVT